VNTLAADAPAVNGSKRASHLTFVIPAYNEVGRIGPGLATLLDYVASKPFAADLILVDDNSRDGTAQYVEERVGGRLPLTILRNEPNRGKGHSVRRGMLAATGEYVMFCDADFSTPIAETDKLLDALDRGADVAIGSRGMKDSQVTTHQPKWREIPGKLFGLMVRALALPGIRDSQCGFKFFRREAAQEIFSRVQLERWAFDVEVLYIARRLGYRTAEVPIRWINDPNTKVRLLVDGPRMVRDIMTVKRRHRDLGQDLK
jgi:dolichyl-phosphate beta-glucosyltransferase